MEKKIIYGVFAIKVELPEKTERKEEITRFAKSMKMLSEEKQRQGFFIRAYNNLEDAVEDCYHSNGCLFERIINRPDGVANGIVATYYFPRTIEVE